MAADDLFYKSILTLFSGFLMFVMIIINRIHSFLDVIDNYFVLFLFSGIIISTIGIILLIAWNFANRKPFEDKSQEPETHFAPYFGAGILLILLGFTVNFYIRSVRPVQIMFFGLSIVGIIFMGIGLAYYVKEVIKAPRAIIRHRQ